MTARPVITPHTTGCACFAAAPGWSALTPITPLQTSLQKQQLAPLSQLKLLHLWPTPLARMLPSARVPGSGSGESNLVLHMPYDLSVKPIQLQVTCTLPATHALCHECLYSDCSLQQNPKMVYTVCSHSALSMQTDSFTESTHLAGSLLNAILLTSWCLLALAGGPCS